MLTFEQKALMAQMIFNEKEILFGEFGADLTKVEKQEKWMEILVKLNSIGGNVNDYKTLRDNEWSNMKRATEKKVQTLASNENKSEDQKINCKPLSPIDEIVLDILGKGRGLTTHKAIASVDEISSLNSFQGMMKYEDFDEDGELDEEENDIETGKFGLISERIKKKINVPQLVKKSENLWESDFTLTYLVLQLFYHIFSFVQSQKYPSCVV
jgi:hypothetical protein